MSLTDRVETETARVEARHDLARLDQLDLTASGKNYPVPVNIICGSGKGALKRSCYVEVERINRRSTDGYKKCFVGI